MKKQTERHGQGESERSFLFYTHCAENNKLKIKTEVGILTLLCIFMKFHDDFQHINLHS